MDQASHPNHRLSRGILPRAAGVVVLCAMLGSCSGADTSRDTMPHDTVQSPAPNAADSVALALQTVQPFDTAAINAAAQSAATTLTPGDVQAARMLTLAESGVNHLYPMMETLVYNGDAADTYNVVCELSSQQWPGAIGTIMQCLESRQRGDVMDTRIRQLRQSIVRVNALKQTAVRSQISSPQGALTQPLIE